MALLTREQRIEEVRFFLGGIPTTDLPDSIIGRYLDAAEALHGTGEDTQCLVIFTVVLQLLRYLDARANIQQGDTRGHVTERSEKIGQITVSQKTDTRSGSTQSGWARALEDYQNNPSLVCPSLVRDKSVAPIIIGGVSKAQRRRVIDNDDGVGVFDQSSPYNPQSQRRVLIEGNYYIYRSQLFLTSDYY